MNKVYEIKEVRLQKLEPSSLTISAAGTVVSSGWTNAQLGRWYYVAPPSDGVYDFDLNANPPIGPSSDVITPIYIETTFTNPPSDLKGVRIHAVSNSVVSSLSEHTSVGLTDSGKKPASDGHAPW